MYGGWITEKEIFLFHDDGAQRNEDYNEEIKRLIGWLTLILHNNLRFFPNFSMRIVRVCLIVKKNIRRNFPIIC